MNKRECCRRRSCASFWPCGHRRHRPETRYRKPHGRAPSDFRLKILVSPKMLLSLTTATGRVCRLAASARARFSRSYRGDFSRWHIKAGVHKYETVYADQFAMFQQSEGEPRRRAGADDGHPPTASYPAGNGIIPLVPANTVACSRRHGSTIGGTNFPHTSRSSSSRLCCPTTIANQAIRSPCTAGTQRIPQTRP